MAVLLASLGGLDDIAPFLLLAAIVAGAVRLIDVVGLAAEGRGKRVAVVMSAAGLVWLVAAGAAHVPLLVLGLLVCVAVEAIVATPVDSVPEPVELLEAPVSRAA